MDELADVCLLCLSVRPVFDVVPGDNPIVSRLRSLPFSRGETIVDGTPMPKLRCFLDEPLSSFPSPEDTGRLETRVPALSISNSSDDRFLALRMGANALGGEVGTNGSCSVGTASLESSCDAEEVSDGRGCLDTSSPCMLRG